MRRCPFAASLSRCGPFRCATRGVEDRRGLLLAAAVHVDLKRITGRLFPFAIARARWGMSSALVAYTGQMVSEIRHGTLRLAVIDSAFVCRSICCPQPGSTELCWFRCWPRFQNAGVPIIDTIAIPYLCFCLNPPAQLLQERQARTSPCGKSASFG